MPIRDKETYARMSLRDFIIASCRLEKDELRLSAFRTYKAERRLLQCLAMVHGIHNKNTPCAVPKHDMERIASQLEKLYPGILEMTRKALKLFDQWKSSNPSRNDIVELLLKLNFSWISQFLSSKDKEQINQIRNSLLEKERSENTDV